MTLWRFGHEPWIDAPFDACVARDAGVLVLQDLETAASRIAVQIHVIDTADGKLKVARLITLSPGATRELTTAIHAQLAAGHANFSAGFNWFNAHSTEALARLGT